jgi:hypothetical protein
LPPSTRESAISAAEIPVPIATNARFAHPWPAPTSHSARPAQVTSWSASTGTSHACSNSSPKASPDQPMFALYTAIRRTGSTMPGSTIPARLTPPVASIRPLPRSAAAVIAAAPRGVGQRAAARTLPSASVISALTEVPPTSTASTRVWLAADMSPIMSEMIFYVN